MLPAARVLADAGAERRLAARRLVRRAVLPLRPLDAAEADAATAVPLRLVPQA